MGAIRTLSSETINKIAAGEVIESPSSCLKEIVENALDAQASDIIIEVEEGGKKRLVVSDCGVGMNEEDAHLCFTRHATSKIQGAQDLFSIHTMGFRGEALAAIASISKTSLTTCPKGSTKATHIEIEGGRLVQEKRSVRDSGTTVEVRDLFFNVPVRKQFQKSLNACMSETHKTVELLALANPEVSFTLLSDDRLILNAPSGNNASFLEKLKGRLLDVFGPSYIQESLELNIKAAGFELVGYLKEPSLSRPNRLAEHLFINRRAVKCPEISNAIKEGLSSSLPEGRFPQFCLHLFLPPEEIDVNIHPQKKEVKLKNPKNLKRAIAEHLAKALHKKAQAKAGTWLYEDKSDLLSNSASFPLADSLPKSGAYKDLQKSAGSALFEQSLMTEKVKPLITSYFFVKHFALFELEAHPGSSENGTFVCNLKAAQRALMYEELLKTEPPVQKLLFPITWEIAPSLMNLANACISFFASLGIYMRAAGPRSFFIDALPKSMDEAEAIQAAELILEEIASSGLGQNDQKTQNEKLKGSIAKTLACRSAQKIPQSAEGKKAFALSLIERHLPSVCPAGEVLFAEMTSEDIEKMLKPERALSFSP